MNCMYCGQPVPTPPSDNKGVALLPQTMHFDCAGRYYDDLNAACRSIYVPRGDTISFRKFAPLTTSTKEQPTDGQE